MQHLWLKIFYVPDRIRKEKSIMSCSMTTTLSRVISMVNKWLIWKYLQKWPEYETSNLSAPKYWFTRFNNTIHLVLTDLNNTEWIRFICLKKTIRLPIFSGILKINIAILTNLLMNDYRLIYIYSKILAI